MHMHNLCSNIIYLGEAIKKLMLSFYSADLKNMYHNLYLEHIHLPGCKLYLLLWVSQALGLQPAWTLWRQSIATLPSKRVFFFFFSIPFFFSLRKQMRLVLMPLTSRPCYPRAALTSLSPPQPGQPDGLRALAGLQ